MSHITQRAVGKDVLFVDRHDYLAMLGFLKEISKKYEVSIHAFCLLPNHIHLLVQPKRENLHLFFRDLCGRYSRRFNRRYERRGHLFGGPFRQSVILDEKYLLAASLYIHLNPVRAGLASDPRGYRYSSCRLYVTPSDRKSFVDPDLVLSLVAHREEDRLFRYRELLARGKSIEAGNVLEDESAIERFKRLLNSTFASILPKTRLSGKDAELVSSSELAEDNPEDFENLRGLRKPESMAAKKYLLEQLLSRGYTRTQIADTLGISRKTVYNLVTYQRL